MNRLARALYLPAAALAMTLLSGCDPDAHVQAAHRAARQSTATVNRTWPVGQIRELHVSEANGAISIEAAAVNEITLLAKAHGNLDIRQDAENQGLFQSTLEGDVLTIERRRERRGGWRLPRFFRDGNQRIDYTIRVPQQVALAVTTVNGRIATRGVTAETRARSVNGAIDVEASGEHPLSATTVNGSVKARFLGSFHGARFKTVNGAVTAFLPQNASFNVDLSQVNGDFEASFPLSINSNPRSRRVSGEVNGGQHELRIVTVNGDVELARLSDSPIMAR